MFEQPPTSELSRGKKRKVARTYVKKAGLRKQAEASLKEAIKAEDHAEYVKRDPLRRMISGVRRTKPFDSSYDDALYAKAPVEETESVPEKGGKRRRAVREYSKTHDVPGQIRKEQERLKELIKEIKRLETGPLTRAVIGARRAEYEERLFEGATTKEEIEKALQNTAEKKLKFRQPTPRRIINITPVARTERVEKKLPLEDDIEDVESERVSEGADQTRAHVEIENAPTITSEEDLEVAVAEAELRGFARELDGQRGYSDDMGVVTMTERQMEKAVAGAEYRGLEAEFARSGKRAGKAPFWRRARAWLSAVGALFLVGYGATKAVDIVEENSRTPESADSRTPENAREITARDSAEVFGPYEGPTDAPRAEREFSEQDLIRSMSEREREHISPELAEARLERALENPATGLEPVSAPQAQEP